MNVISEPGKWTAIVLAGGRGPDDPLAKTYSVSHKCLLPVAGTAMLKRVVDTLQSHPAIGHVAVSIDDFDIAEEALGDVSAVELLKTGSSAAQSAGMAVRAMGERFPILLTTADHALLDHAMLDHFLGKADQAQADLAVGLARAETILTAYPVAKRTFLTFGADRVSGCNLYALKTARALVAVDFWQRIEHNRKNPFSLVKAFGLGAVLRYLTHRLTLESAFVYASKRLGLEVVPVVMPFANAAVDIDKPADRELVERILSNRS
jgi:GTP:adenosylcobinamide-phosphate guanylyltransferase